MEIVCKNCDARYYLSDDKIPLETRTGKCKKCGTTITVFGKNTFNSDSIIQQEISDEPETMKDCEFCGEKILAIAKKCRYCGSMLDDNHISNSQNQTEQTIKLPNKKPTDNINDKIDNAVNTVAYHLSNRYQTIKNIIKMFVLAVFLLGIGTAIIIFFQIPPAPKDVTTILEYRNGIAYLPNETKPFTGKFERYYLDNGLNNHEKTAYSIYRESNVVLQRDPVIDLKTHTDGAKESELERLWYSYFGRQKIFEENYKDGKLNGLASSWEKNGRKDSEITYENGKLKGLSTIWYEDGNKLSINFSGILTKNLSEEQISLATEKMHTSTDDIEGVTWYQDYSHYISKDSLITYSQTRVYLYVGLFKETKNVKLRLVTQYAGDYWIFANSFIVVTDGKKFEKTNVEFRRFGENTQFESYDKLVTIDDLEMIKSIIESRQATIRFKGIRSFKDHEITEREKQAMKNVLSAFEALGGQFENWDK